MTDLDSRPLSEPVASETIVVKPNIQNTITQNMGNKNIDFFFPDYIGYMLPSQSYISMTIEMEGRGNPIPSPSAGFHSLFNTIRSYDGTNSNLLSEMVQYNTQVSQIYSYAKTDSLLNTRLMFEGLNPTDNYTNNAYWSPKGIWAATPFNASSNALSFVNEVAKPVQINSTLKTFLLSTEKFLPLNVMGGLRTSLQLEDYRRSLEFLTGGMGVQSGADYSNGMCPTNTLIKDATSTDGFTVSITGAGYTTDNVYPIFDSNNDCRGFVNVGTVAAGGDVVANQLKWLCTSSGSNTPPTFETGNLTIGILGVGAGQITTVAVIRVTQFANLYGNLAVGSVNSPYFVDIGTFDPTSSLNAGAAPVALLNFFGGGVLRKPFRCLNPIPANTSGNGQADQFPTNNNVFTIGDFIYLNTALTASVGNEKPLGVVTGFSRADRVQNNFFDNAGTAHAPDGGQAPLRVFFAPNAAPITGLPLLSGTTAKTGIAVGTLGGGTAGTGYSGTPDGETGNGFQIYVKLSDRVNGTASSQLNHVAPTYNPEVATRMNAKVGFKINNLQYQVKKVMLDERIAQADMAAANGAGYKFDVEETFTQLSNLPDTTGPTNQLISNPNITRALGVLSVPLNQNDQFEINKQSLVGNPSNMSNYQYDMGTDGRQPIRAVPVEKASLDNPLVETQHISELIKTNEAFGYFTSNLSKVGMNFAVGRCFSRPNMFYDLMRAGSLMLLANYESASSGQKLFIHFIHHLRSITFSRNNVSIAN